jgi:membrane protein involved in colicin uptake
MEPPPRSGEEVPSKHADAWGTARGHLANGTGLGVPIIRAYGVGGMSKHRVEQAVANLKALETGGMADIIRDARQEYEAEIQQHEAAEAKRLEEIKRQQAEEERQRKEAEKRRKDLERQRKEAEKAKDLARQKAIADLKAKAEQDERKRHALHEATRIAREKAAAARAAAQQAEQERLRRAREAEEKMRQQAKEKGVHVSLLNAMSNHELKFFRDAASPAFTVDEQPALWKDTVRALVEIPPVGREAHRKEVLIPAYIAGRAELRGRLRDFFPNEAEHHALVVNAIATIRSGTGAPLVDEQTVRIFLNRKRAERDAQTKADFEKWRAEEEAQKWNKKADRVMSEMGAAVGRAAAVAREVDLLFKEADSPERRREIMALAHTTSLRKNTYALKGALKALEETFNLYEHSVDYEQTVASIDPAAYDGTVIDTQ